MRPSTVKLVSTALAIALGLAGCAREKKELAGPAFGNGNGAPPPSSGIVPGTTGSCTDTPPAFNSGSSVTLTIDNSNRLRDYVGTPLNNPGPVTLMVNFNPYTITNSLGTYKSFGGEMHIAFMDCQGGNPSIYHNGSFTAGDGVKVFDYYGDYHSNCPNGSPCSYDTKWNTWDPIIDTNTKAKATGKFRAFLEDAGTAKPGSLLLTVDSVSDNGQLSGSVYYYNFNSTATHPPTYCWFVYDGPYDCRDFGVPPTTTGKYIRLGTFTGLDRASALHE